MPRSTHPQRKPFSIPFKLDLDEVGARSDICRQPSSEAPRRSAAQSARSSRISGDGNTLRSKMRMSARDPSSTRFAGRLSQAVQCRMRTVTSEAVNWAKPGALQPMSGCTSRRQNVQSVQNIVVPRRRLMANRSLNRTVCGGPALGFISFSPKANPPQTAG